MSYSDDLERRREARKARIEREEFVSRATRRISDNPEALRVLYGLEDDRLMGEIMGRRAELASEGSTPTGFSPRLHVSIEDIDPKTVDLLIETIICIQVDPMLSPEDKEAQTLKWEAAWIAKNIERLERESPRNSAKIRDLQQKEIQLLRGMTAPQELKRLDKEIEEMEKTIKSSRWTAPKRILKKQREKFNDLITERILVERQMEELRRAGNSWLFPHDDPLASR